MRILLIIALLTGLLLAPLAVLAEESAVMEPETEVGNASEEAMIADATISDLAPMFGKIHATLLMATEEAYAYLLTNDTAEKQAYYDDVAASEKALAAFEDAAANAGENETVLVDGYGVVVDEFGNMTTAADVMFTSFEAEGKPVQEDVVAFEASVDAVFNATDNVWVEYRAGDEVPQTAESSVRALYGRLLSAVQESYAYPVLGETIEKDDAIDDFADFESQLGLSEEKYPETSFDDLRVMNHEILLAAVTMFDNYEKDGSVKAEDVAALETLVEKMNQEWMKLYGETSSDDVTDIEENPVTEDAAANATA